MRNQISILLIVFAVIIGVFSLSLPIFCQSEPERDIIPKKEQVLSPTIPPDNQESEKFSLSLIIFGILLIGFVLLFLEVTLIPGTGVAIIAALLILAGLGLAFWKLELKIAILFALGSFIGTVAVVLWMIYVFPHTSLGKKFVLETRITVEDGYTATSDMSPYVGMIGTAQCDLRPSGIAKFGDDRVDVVSEGEYIPRGTTIKALKVKNSNLIVTKVSDSDASKS
ncbi:MAG: NfeD family protein [Candidatus Riflebacteria bacterium]|nr:NfeD family protein [Candidatus Riflebacteria bacterium]